MYKREQKIIYSNYSGVEKKAIELINKEISSIVCRDKGVYTIHVLPIEKDGCEIDKSITAIGCYSEKIGDVLIADAVVKLVNETAAERVSSEDTIKNDIDLLTPFRRNLDAEWIRYGKYAYDFTKKLHEFGSREINLNFAAQLSGKIWFPFSLLSEILWNTDRPYEEILASVIKRKNISLSQKICHYNVLKMRLLNI